MKPWAERHGPLAILLLAGLLPRLAVIGTPAVAVWDEHHFVRMSQAYLQGRYYFDIHPPLGKLLIALSLKGAGASPKAEPATGGRPYPPGFPYAAGRLFPAIAGGLLPAIVFGLALALGLSRGPAFLAGALTAADTALFAASRLAFIDVFVHLFQAIALLAYLRHRMSPAYSARWWTLLGAAALGTAAALSVKWTGAAVAGVILLVSAVDAVRSREFRPLLLRGSLIVGTSALLYAGLFALHFALLPASGTGDGRMSERFRASLRSTPESKRGDLAPLGFAGRFIELHQVVWTKNTTGISPHPQESEFYEWPLGRRRIHLLGASPDRGETLIMIANPVVWGFGGLSTAAALLYPLLRRRRWTAWIASDATAPQKRFALQVLLVLYAANLFPFAAIARSMYLYHYFSALLASLLLGALFCFEILPAVEGARPARRPAALLIASAASMFIFLSPVTFGYLPRFPSALVAYLSL